ncbi:MAG: hypothetical protein P4L62_01945 [Candidatus Pacebacteria bacterium]|nr:hypothetical protein [Candidatus Paceibacterota bacterium]MDR3583098.1 hypothetical protein [Candidatus Paceibacterota bacterium]
MEIFNVDTKELNRHIGMDVIVHSVNKDGVFTHTAGVLREVSGSDFVKLETTPGSFRIIRFVHFGRAIKEIRLFPGKGNPIFENSEIQTGMKWKMFRKWMIVICLICGRILIPKPKETQKVLH